MTTQELAAVELLAEAIKVLAYKVREINPETDISAVIANAEDAYETAAQTTGR